MCSTSLASFSVIGARFQCPAKQRIARKATPMRCVAEGHSDVPEPKASRGRRELMLNGTLTPLVLGGLFDGVLGAGGSQERPQGLGLHQYGDIITLGLCPPAPNCVSTAEDLNDDSHFVPPWTFNPQEGRGIRNPATQEQAMEELVDVIQNTDCDGYETNIVTKLSDYLYVEYKSPRLGLIDDVEFFFAPDPTGSSSLARVDYRTSGRVDAPKSAETQRKRIKTLRLALQKKGWKSVGF